MARPIKKVHNLSRMRIREISLVDAPASPGAHVILAKRAPTRPLTFEDVQSTLLFEDFVKYSPDQPRDDHGRWTTIGAHIRALGQRAVGAARAAVQHVGHSAGGTRVQRVLPVRGGGLHFEVNTPVKGSLPITTFVQLRPEHLAGNTQAIHALNVAHRVLTNFGREEKPALTGQGIFGAFRGSLFGERPDQQSAVFTNFRAQHAAAALEQQRTGRLGAGIGVPQPSADELKSMNGEPNPYNGFPMNNKPGLKLGDQLVPLNGPTIDYSNSRTMPYLDRDGNFIPGGSEEDQKFIHQTLNAPAGSAPRVPLATLETVPRDRTGFGVAYRVKDTGDIVPAGLRDKQERFETRYRAWIQNEMPVLAYMKTLVPRTVLSIGPTDAQIHANNPVAKSIFGGGLSGRDIFPMSTDIFKGSQRVLPFGRGREGSPRSFEKAFSALQARDQLGRWTAGGAAMFASGAKRLFGSRAATAGIKTLTGTLGSPGSVAALAARSVGALGVPDEITEGTAQAVKHVVDAIAARVAAHPKFREVVGGLSRKILSSKGLLFRKSRIGIDFASRAALSMCPDDVMQETSLLAGISKGAV